MPHGEVKGPIGGVMMTWVENTKEIFVHASDVQLLDITPIEQILAWKPDIVLASGPPLYLRHLSSRTRKRSREIAMFLAERVPVLILDHHIIRNEEGSRFLEDLSASVGHTVFCATDYMGRKRLPLEAWHKAYSQGKVNTDSYREWRGISIQAII